MGSSQAVYVKCGEQQRLFQWGNPAVSLTIANGASNPIYKEGHFSTFQAILGSPTPGALTGTVVIQASNDDNTGRGWRLGGEDQPGFMATTTAASATVTSVAGGIFTPALVGSLFSSPNVPLGTTVAAVATTGLTLTLSSGVGVLAGTAPANILAQNWNATAFGTITLSGTTTAAIATFSDGFSTVASWRYVRALVSNLTGVGANIVVIMGL